MTRHGQRPAQVKVTRLPAVARPVLSARLAAPAACGVSTSVPGNSQFSPSGVLKTGGDASSTAAKGKNPPPGAATNPASFAKTP